jgi:hypothetical protein
MEEFFLNTFYQANITLLPKPNKSIIKRKVLKYWPRNSINTDDKILNKILETQA